MEYGYIVWNESIYENEFYGVCKTREEAEELLERVQKFKYPNLTKEEIDEYEYSIGSDTKITFFEKFSEINCPLI